MTQYVFKDVLRWITHDWYIHNNWLVSPHAVIAPVEPEASTQALIRPYSAILHSNAGPSSTGWASLIKYWRRSDITGEAHLQIATDGTAVQAIPFNRRADCNYKANRWHNGKEYVGAISFETQDNGAATLPYTPWSVSQIETMVSILTCLCVQYGIWCSTPTAWNDSGIGYHSQYKEWSSYVGKTCPGASRIRQMDYIRNRVAGNLAEYGKATGWQCGKAA